MKNETRVSELQRLRNEQIKTLSDSVFGGFSPEEQAAYDAKAKRIHDLEIQCQPQIVASLNSELDVTAAKQQNEWNKTAETDIPQNEGRQPYNSRETDSANDFATESKRSRGKSKADPTEDRE